MASDVRDVIDRETIKNPEEHGRDDDVITREDGDTNIVSEPSRRTTKSTTIDQDMPSESLSNWPTARFNGDNTELYEQLELLKEEIKKRDTKIEQLEDHVLTLETEPLSSKKKRRLSNDELEKQLSDSKDDKILRLQKENERLKRQLGEEPVAVNDKSDYDATIMDTGKLMKMIEEKLNSGLQAIQTNVKSIIDERLNAPKSQLQSHSYANAVGDNRSARVSDLRSLMLAKRMRRSRRKKTEAAE